MENNNKKCSLNKHNEKDAIIFCKSCSIYMCKKCEAFHSELFNHHDTIILNKNNNESLIYYCKEENHKDELKYYWNTHKIFCCVSCISKIKTKNDGKHSECEVYLINEMKNNKQKEYNDKMNDLENNNKKLCNIL